MNEALKYEIVLDEVVGSHVIHITEGHHSGVKFSLGVIEAVETDEEDNVTIRFDYDLHSVPETLMPEDSLTEESLAGLEADIAEILHDILTNQLADSVVNETN